MRSVQHDRITIRWILIPILGGVLMLGGCSLFGSSSAITPAEQTVTAIVTNAPVLANCPPSPQLAYTTTSLISGNPGGVALLGHTSITLVGTCWRPTGRTVTFGVLGRSNTGQPQIVQLLQTPGTAATPQPQPSTPVATTPITATIGADGTFAVTFTLASELQPFVWDNRLPIVAQEDGFVGFAATSVEVSTT
jgi:hypothetical protein